MWRDDDQTWAETRGVSLDALDEQLRLLRADDETLVIDRPATLDDGIHWLDASKLDTLELPAHRITTFVPASGAASRMFKSVVNAHAAGLADRTALRSAIEAGNTGLASAAVAFDGRDALAIGGKDTLAATLHDWMVEQAYQNRPKGLVPLHVYPDGVRTAVAEHVLEAAALVGHPAPNVHFTVPDGQQAAFEDEVKANQARLGGEPVLSLSIQHPSTDTVAVAPDGTLFRDESGAPLLRPGGHGSLITNLADLQGDLIVIKNIDNVTRDDNREAVVQWRRGLVARLVELETRVRKHLADLAAGAEPGPAIDFAVRTFGRRGSGDDALAMAHNALLRPIRVVAVVRNEGQPGGGPFWVREQDGTATPQIMESAQINRADPHQLALFSAATHFNPVDLALSVRAPDGSPFPLQQFVDPRGWLRANKTYQGRPLRALERPGLWNGAMAGWNTQFVEVPSWTFRPVKELKDLLGEGHAAPLA